MNWFYLLLFAHLLGDFPLQSDFVFRKKQKSMMGVLLHVAIFAAAALVIFIPFLGYWPVWVAILLLSLFHVALDQFKLTIANSSASDRFLYFIVDQILHFLSLWLAGVWLSKMLLHIPAPSLYQDTRLLIIINSLVIAGFAGSLLLFYMEKMVLHRSGQDQNLLFPKQKERSPGIMLRIVVTAGLITGGWYNLALLLIPLCVFRHPMWYNHQKPMYLQELLANLAVCLACAAWVWLS